MASLNFYQKTNDETNEIEALLAQAEAIKDSPDSYLDADVGIGVEDLAYA